MTEPRETLDDALEQWRAQWTSNDLYIPRPEVPGHAMANTAAGRNFVITCECGWKSQPLHLSNLTAAENRHRIEATA